jgi:hypothetical protein
MIALLLRYTHIHTHTHTHTHKHTHTNTHTQTHTHTHDMIYIVVSPPPAHPLPSKECKWFSAPHPFDHPFTHLINHPYIHAFTPLPTQRARTEPLNKKPIVKSLLTFLYEKYFYVYFDFFSQSVNKNPWPKAYSFFFMQYEKFFYVKERSFM